MSNMILVTGGARSGKSIFAEQLANKCGENILYIASSVPFDDEMKERVKKHKLQRPSNWETLECYEDFEKFLPKSLEGKDAAMLDCVTIMVTNIMFKQAIDFDKVRIEDTVKMEEAVKKEVEGLINAVRHFDLPFIMVTNEVGMGIVPDNAISRAFRDIAGRMNQLIAKEANEVYLCVSGIPVKIK